MTTESTLIVRLSRILLVTNLRTLRRARMGLQMDLEFLQEQIAQRGSDVLELRAVLSADADSTDDNNGPTRPKIE